MKNENLFVVILTLTTITGVLIAGCTQTGVDLKKESEQVAENFIRNSSTFQFDGKDLELVNSEVLGCEGCFNFQFNFTSTHGGYGNRSGKMVTQVITPHTAKIELRNKTVTKAVLDEKWDMIEQTPISEDEESIAQTKARKFVENSKTYEFDGFDLELNETLYPDHCENCYQFVFDFKSRHAGYGNRTGKGLAQVITPHKATITIENSEITKALLDQKWDIENQKMLANETE